MGTREQSIAGFIFARVRWVRPATDSFENEAKALTRPTSPEVTSVCPTHDLAAPMIRGRDGVCEARKTSLIPCISIKSPSDVPDSELYA